MTGGIASGKNTVADIFHKKFGINIIDLDTIARNLVLPGSMLLKKITEKFGNEILDQSNNLDRKKLRDLIFQNYDYKIWLEELLHPAIDFEVKNQIKLLEHDISKKNNLDNNNNNNNNYCIIVIPLLTKDYLKSHTYINHTIVVDCPEKLQIARGQKRDKQTQEQIANIIKQQISRADRLLLANDVIINTGDVRDLEAEVDRLHDKYSN